MRRKHQRHYAGSRPRTERKERAAQKAIMRANGMSEARYQELAQKYSHAGVWKAFSAGVAELGPRWKKQQELQPNIVWQFLGWLYIKVKRFRLIVERAMREAEAERDAKKAG